MGPFSGSHDLNSIPSARYFHDEQTACDVVESRIWVHGRVCPKHGTVGESGDAFDRAMDVLVPIPNYKRQ